MIEGDSKLEHMLRAFFSEKERESRAVRPIRRTSSMVKKTLPFGSLEKASIFHELRSAACLREWEVLRFVADRFSGREDAWLRSHVDACDRCADLVSRLEETVHDLFSPERDLATRWRGQLEERVAARAQPEEDAWPVGFSSSPCPDPERIALYLSEKLSDAEVVKFEGHIARCSRCSRIVGSAIRSRRSEKNQSDESDSPVPNPERES